MKFSRVFIAVPALCAILVACLCGWHRARPNDDQIAAVKAGDTARVHELLDGGADPNARDQWGVDDPTIKCGLVCPVTSLVSAHEPPPGPTALILAIRGDDTTMAADLLRHKAHPSRAGDNWFGEAAGITHTHTTPLALAAWF